MSVARGYRADFCRYWTDYGKRYALRFAWEVLKMEAHFWWHMNPVAKLRHRVRLYFWLRSQAGL